MYMGNDSKIENEIFCKLQEAEREAETTDKRYSSEEVLEAMREEQGKTERNAAYLRKLERGLEQVHAGDGITKIIEELEALEGNNGFASDIFEGGRSQGSQQEREGL